MLMMSFTYPRSKWLILESKAPRGSRLLLLVPVQLVNWARIGTFVPGL